jgi:hypothetical protein
MAVDRQIYTAIATWTTSGMVDIFEQAFIDAGIMTAWHDSFLSGSVENRIVEITYNVQTYGKTYLWFKFTTTYVAISICSGWNSGGNVPNGTILLDYTDATTNSIGFHRTILTLSPTITTTLTRYTSSDNPDFSWFLLRNGSSQVDFHIENNADTASFVDTTKVIATPIIFSEFGTSSSEAVCGFRIPVFAVRRSYFQSNTAYNYSNATSGIANGFYYIFVGRQSVPVFANHNGIVLPVARTEANPEFTVDRIPLFTGLQLSPYTNTSLPADFALMPHWIDNTMQFQDRMIVTAGVEEWEVIDRINSPNPADIASALLVARVV